MGTLLIFTVLVVVVVVALVAAVKGIQRGRGASAQAAVASSPEGASLAIGGLLAGHTLREHDGFFEWKHIYGKGFKVPASAVQTVLVEKTGWGKSTLKVVGAGTELARVPDLPHGWAEQAQAWLLQRLTK
jgi:hypothetical protein